MKYKVPKGVVRNSLLLQGVAKTLMMAGCGHFYVRGCGGMWMGGSLGGRQPLGGTSVDAFEER